MRDSIISYFDMCQSEGSSLQRGMNFRLGGDYSVILMSVQNNAPYKDKIEDDGSTLIYEGHDHARFPGVEPKLVDQPKHLPSGRPTENGKFYRAAKDYQDRNNSPERVRVYEKLKKGIWADNGYFDLIDAWQENDGRREVFKFKLQVASDQESKAKRVKSNTGHEPNRIIPTSVKIQVWKRDKGKCVMCGATDEIHFDHIIPYTKGGTSNKVENVQILCARHNIQKSNRIE